MKNLTQILFIVVALTSTAFASPQAEYRALSAKPVSESTLANIKALVLRDTKMILKEPLSIEEDGSNDVVFQPSPVRHKIYFVSNDYYACKVQMTTYTDEGRDRKAIDGSARCFEKDLTPAPAPAQEY